MPAFKMFFIIPFSLITYIEGLINYKDINVLLQISIDIVFKNSTFAP